MNNRAGKETRCLLESISFGVINAWNKHINCTDFFSFFFLLFFRLKSLWSDKTVFRMTLSATVAGKFVRCQISAVHHLRIWLLCDCVSNKFITVLTLIKRLNYIRIQFYRMRGTLDPRPPNENVFLGNVNQKEKNVCSLFAPWFHQKTSDHLKCVFAAHTNQQRDTRMIIDGHRCVQIWWKHHILASN